MGRLSMTECTYLPTSPETGSPPPPSPPDFTVISRSLIT